MNERRKFTKIGIAGHASIGTRFAQEMVHRSLAGPERVKVVGLGMGLNETADLLEAALKAGLDIKIVNAPEQPKYPVLDFIMPEPEQIFNRPLHEFPASITLIREHVPEQIEKDRYLTRRERREQARRNKNK